MLKQQEKLRQLITQFWLTEGVGPIFVKKLLIGLTDFDFLTCQQKKEFDFDAFDFKNADPDELSALCGLSKRDILNCQQNLAKIDIVEKELENLDKCGATLTTIIDEDYPPLLRQIYAPPPVLTFRGEIKTDWQKSIAIVGSRSIKNYAIRSLDLLLPSLLQNSFTTISGGAIGVDSLVHQKSLDFAGKTVVVLGSGLESPYPKSNEKLFERVVEKNGLIISTFPCKSPAVKGNFPARNRVIAGLSPACLVIQAAEQSGALITADFALSEGREVMAIPGPIDDPAFKGNNNLLISGANLICQPEGIFQAFSMSDYLSSKNNESKNENLENKNFEEKDDLIGIAKHFTDGPVGIEELVKITGLPMNQVQEELFELEMDGKIRQNLSGMWEITLKR